MKHLKYVLTVVTLLGFLCQYASAQQYKDAVLHDLTGKVKSYTLRYLPEGKTLNQDNSNLYSIKSASFSANGKEKDREYRYSSSGVPVARDKSEYPLEKYTYDYRGRLIKEERLEGLSFETLFTYTLPSDMKYKTVKTYQRDASGHIISETVYSDVNTYSNYKTDKYGNWIKRDYNSTSRGGRGVEYRDIVYQNGEKTSALPALRKRT